MPFIAFGQQWKIALLLSNESQNGRLQHLHAGAVPAPNAQVRERKVEVKFKKPWNLLLKMPAVAGTTTVDFEKLPWMLATYDEIRTYFIENLREAE